MLPISYAFVNFSQIQQLKFKNNSIFIATLVWKISFYIFNATLMHWIKLYCVTTKKNHYGIYACTSACSCIPGAIRCIGVQ